MKPQIPCDAPNTDSRPFSYLLCINKIILRTFSTFDFRDVQHIFFYSIPPSHILQIKLCGDFAEWRNFRYARKRISFQITAEKQENVEFIML